MFRFEKLEVWKEAIHYSRKLYLLTEKIPSNEVYGLIAQIKHKEE